MESIVGFVERNGEITNYRAQLLTGLSADSVKKYLANFVDMGILVPIGDKKGRKYIVKSNSL